MRLSLEPEDVSMRAEPTRDEIARLAIQETALRETILKQPCTTQEDARRFVRFACQCVSATPLGDGLTPVTIPDFPQRLKDGLSLAELWAAGRDLPRAVLEDILATSHRAAYTFSTRLSGAAAAEWAALSALEATLKAVVAGEKQELLAQVTEAAARAARYARAAGDPSLEAIEYQKTIFREIFPTAPESASK
jgi:hypothetical protein